MANLRSILGLCEHDWQKTDYFKRTLTFFGDYTGTEFIWLYTCPKCKKCKKVTKTV